jgi:hypothetical protein
VRWGKHSKFLRESSRWKVDVFFHGMFKAQCRFT